MNFLVTGGAGFIGSHLCEALINDNHKVVCLDNFDEFYAKSIKQVNIRDLKENPKFHLITSDVRNTDDLIDILISKKIEAVFHLAGRSGSANSIKNPLEFISTNVEGTVSLLEAMKEAEIQQLIFVSSSSVYGNTDEAPFKENSTLGTPTSTYAATKESAETFVQMYHELYDISAIVLRMFSVYGPRQRPDSGIYQFVHSNLKGMPLGIYSEGKIMRDYTYVDDIVHGIVAAYQHLQKQIEKGQSKHFDIFNLGSGSPININSILEIIEHQTNAPFKTQSKRPPVGNMNAAYADIDKAKKILGYQPKMTIENGIKNVIDWMRITS